MVLFVADHWHLPCELIRSSRVTVGPIVYLAARRDLWQLIGEVNLKASLRPVAMHRSRWHSFFQSKCRLGTDVRGVYNGKILASAWPVCLPCHWEQKYTAMLTQQLGNYEQCGIDTQLK